MMLLVYSAYTAKTIEGSLGLAEYSYWFVRRAFRPALERFGIVTPITDPEREVNQVCASARAHGQDCVFLSFEPPHKTPLDLACRTIPVFAWEFDTLPTEEWEDDPRQDWRRVLRGCGSAITHSNFSAQTVRKAMGADYPVWSIPAPVYAANAGYAAEARGYQPPTEISITGIAIDSALADLDVFSINRAHDEGILALRALSDYLAAEARESRRLTIAGVVYTAVFNPVDGRKNFTDFLGAFIWAFRDVPDATLVMKITHADADRGLLPVLSDVAKFGRFACRVLLIHGMLPDDEYRALVRVTSYTVNASTNEGQCLPLMEFMAAGRPAVAPCHTSMLDYLTPQNNFTVPCFERPAAWPHDPREALRTTRNVVSVAGMIRAYRESYRVARHAPQTYAAMSQAATEAMARFCGDDVIHARLAEVLAHTPARAAAADRQAEEA